MVSLLAPYLHLARDPLAMWRLHASATSRRLPTPA